jgi:hypothetical protein
VETHDRATDAPVEYADIGKTFGLSHRELMKSRLAAAVAAASPDETVAPHAAPQAGPGSPPDEARSRGFAA